MMRRHKCLLAMLALPACAAIGSAGAGDRDLPTAGVGPFRKLDGDELLGVAPFVLDDRVSHYRKPAILRADPGASDTNVVLFAVTVEETDAGVHDVIVRSRADDARSFFGTSSDPGHAPVVVLRADAAWEGDVIGDPSAVWIDGRVFLYYAGASGIGVARSSDGKVFQKEPAPILTVLAGVNGAGRRFGSLATSSDMTQKLPALSGVPSDW